MQGRLLFCSTEIILLQSVITYLPLTNRVQGPYCKLQTKFSPFVYGPSVKRVGHKSKVKNEDP